MLLGRPGDSLTDIHDKPYTTCAHSCEFPAKRIGSLDDLMLPPVPNVLPWDYNELLGKAFPDGILVPTTELNLVYCCLVLGHLIQPFF